jgi:hypothetical protein
VRVHGVGGNSYFFFNGAEFDFHPGEIWRIRYNQDIILEALKIGEIDVVGAS